MDVTIKGAMCGIREKEKIITKSQGCQAKVVMATCNYESLCNAYPKNPLYSYDTGRRNDNSSRLKESRCYCASKYHTSFKKNLFEIVH